MRHLFTMIALTLVCACSVTDIVGEPDSQTGDQLNPNTVKSAEGAMTFYAGTVALQGDAAARFAIESGTLTDELRPAFYPGVFNFQRDPFDSRTIPEGDLLSFSFGRLQSIRANARQGRGVLAEFLPTGPSALTGHLYAVEALADVMLADLYCSGVPLSTVNYDGTFTLYPGSTTAEVYDAAVALFDSASALSTDSARILNLAAVGKGRALLALGKYQEAAAAVSDVPTSYVYDVVGRETFVQSTLFGYGAVLFVSDLEGGRGLPYASSGDPRSATDTVAHQETFVFPTYVARKYGADGRTPMVLASGIEARLIEAEADLRAGGSAWLDILNAVRADSALPALSDTALAPIPEGKTALQVRLDQLLAERGYWLFLTGHRQGDLRRIVRNDQRSQQTLYPTGLYPGGGSYGSAIVIPLPTGELQNPRYTGCINQEA